MVNLLKINEIRELSNKDLESKIRDAKKELFDLRMKQATGTLENPSKKRIVWFKNETSNRYFRKSFQNKRTS